MILYVEDDPMLRELIAQFLVDNGLACVPVATGTDALRIIEAKIHDFRLLLSDVNLQGTVDGFAVAERFKEIYPAGEVIMMSGDIAPEDIQSLRSDGRQAFRKPMPIGELLDAVNEALKKGGREADSGKEAEAK